ncbi:unnamed protein product [Rhizophagus irregularis]|nr:unnamed protein product [Rhizophagus irregularis]
MSSLEIRLSSCLALIEFSLLYSLDEINGRVQLRQCDYELMHLYLYVMGCPKAERLELHHDILIPLNRDLNTGRDCQSPPPPNVTQAFF